MVNRIKIVSKFTPYITVYLFIVVFALGFDLLTDRSFGALMLSVLPISLVAFLYLVVGVWVVEENKENALKGWFAGAFLILVISITFARLGVEQAKTGEDIFTYALIILAFPSSLLLPFAEIWLSDLTIFDNVFIRIIVAWIICVVMGWFEWRILAWLHANTLQRLRRK